MQFDVYLEPLPKKSPYEKLISELLRYGRMFNTIYSEFLALQYSSSGHRFAFKLEDGKIIDLFSIKYLSGYCTYEFYLMKNNLWELRLSEPIPETLISQIVENYYNDFYGILLEEVSKIQVSKIQVKGLNKKRFSSTS